MRYFLRILGLALTSFLLALLLAGWWVYSAPRSVALLIPYIEESLNRKQSDFRIEIGQGYLTWAGWKQGFGLRLQDVKALSSRGKTLVNVPGLSVRLNPFDLFRGKIVAAGIDVFDPDFFVDTGEQGPHQLHLYPIPDWETGHDRGEEHIGGALSYDTQTGRLTVSLQITDVTSDWLAMALPRIDFLRSFDGSVSGNISLNFDDSGGIHNGSFTLFSRSEHLSIGLEQGTLGTQGVRVRNVSVAGRLAPNAQVSRTQGLIIDRFDMNVGDAHLSASGMLDLAGRNTSLRGQARVTNLPVASLAHYWPQQGSDFAQQWIEKNLPVGLITQIEVSFSFALNEGATKQSPLLETKLFHGTLAFEGLETIYLETMPSLTASHGSGFFTRDTVGLFVRGGHVDSLTLSEGYVSLTELDSEFEQAHIEAHVYGSASDLLDVLSHKPIEADVFLDLDTQAVRGPVRASATFSFPMLRDLGINQVDLAARIDLEDGRLDNIIAGRSLQNARANIVVDKEKLAFQGFGLWNGIDVDFSGRTHFSDQAPFRSRYTVESTLDDRVWARWGAAQNFFVSGTTDLNLIWTDFDRVRSSVAVDADFSDAALQFPLLGWKKERGDPGLAQLNVSTDANGVSLLEDFSLTATGLDATGRGKMESQGAGLGYLMISPLRTGRSDLDIEAIFGPADIPLIKLSGRSVDLAPFLANDQNTTDATIPDFSAHIDIDKMWVGQDMHLPDVKGTLDYKDESWHSVDIASRDDHIRVSPDPATQSRNVSLRLGNAGEWLRAGGLYPHMVGGSLSFSGTTDDTQEERPLTGIARITDFEIKESPLFARLLSLASPDGLLERLGGGGLGFRRATIPLHLSQDRVTIDQGYTVGSVGLTFEGMFDFERSAIDMAGTIIPSYTLNSLLGDIPLIGDVLTGDEDGGGILALTYQVNGGFDEPRVTINPLSVLTPGILRGFVEFFQSLAPRTPQDNPSQEREDTFSE